MRGTVEDDEEPGALPCPGPEGAQREQETEVLPTEGSLLGRELSGEQVGVDRDDC